MVTKTVQSLELRFEAEAVPLGKSTQWQAIGKYDDGTEEDLTDKVSWTTSNDAVAAISELTEQRGWLVTIGQGFTAVSAALGTMSTSKRFEVKPAVVESLDISPRDLTVGIGKNLQLTATAKYSDDSRADITDEVTFASSDESVALMSATDNGYLVPRGKGSTTITATYDGTITDTTSFEITDATVDRIELSPDNPRLQTGSTLRMTATGIYTDQTRVDITRMVTWSVTDETILRVNEFGVVTALQTGDADVIATFEAVNKQTTIRAWTQGDCNYPDNATTIAYGEPFPQLEWQNAFAADDSQIDFRMAEFHCGEAYAQYDTIVFVVGAGWCPNCPRFMRYVADQSAELEAAGMLIVYMEIETRSRQPATNQQSKDIVDREVGEDAPGIKIGGGDTLPMPGQFSRVVRAVPTAYVVRQSDMQVIADQMRGSGYLPLLDIAQNPDGTW